MPYCRVDRCRSGKSLIAYCENHGIAHSGDGPRNVAMSINNLIPGQSIYQQMDRLWKRASTQHEVQVIAVMQSFSRKEFDPSDPVNHQIVNHLGLEFARTHYPDRQVAVYTQVDGDSGLLHNHILINDVGIDDYKGCSKEQYHFETVKQWTNEIASQYATLDIPDENAKDKKTRTERAKVADGKWSVRDEIKKRVIMSMIGAFSESDFLLRLRDNGVSATRKTSKKYGDHYVYELLDIPDSETVRNAKARSYKLGRAYGVEALEKVIGVRHETIAQPVIDNDYEPEMKYKKRNIEDDKKAENENEDNDEDNDDVDVIELLNRWGLLDPNRTRISKEEFDAIYYGESEPYDIFADVDEPPEEVVFENSEPQENESLESVEFVYPETENEDDENIDVIFDEISDEQNKSNVEATNALNDDPVISYSEQSVDDPVVHEIAQKIGDRIETKRALKGRMTLRRLPDYAEDDVMPDEKDVTLPF